MGSQKPTLEEFRHELGKYAEGKSDEELQQLQELHKQQQVPPLTFSPSTAQC